MLATGLFVLKFFLDQHAGRWRGACSHRGLACSSIQVGRGQGEDQVWHVPVEYSPSGTMNAWLTAAQLWEDSAEESCDPVLPQAA